MLLSVRSRGIIEALLSATFFGLIPILFIPINSTGISPETFLMYRFGLATLMMLIPIAFKKRSLSISLKTHVFTAFAGFSYYITALLLYSAFTFIASGVIVTVFFTNPIFVMLLMALVYKEKIEVYQVTLMLSTLFGIALFSGVFTSQTSLNIEGISYALLASLGYAIYVLALFSLKGTEISNEVISFYLFASCTICSIIYSLFTGEFVLAKTGFVWLFLFLSALITAILANVLLMSAIKKIGSVLATILGVMEPITAVAIGIFVFGEAVDIYILTGVCIVILSVVLITVLPMLRSGRKISS